MLLCASDAGEIVIRAKGEVRGTLLRYLATGPEVVVAVAAGSYWGVAGAAAGILVATAVQHFLMAQLLLRLVEGTWFDYFRAQFPGGVAAASHGILALFAVTLLREWQLPNALVLALSAGASAMAFAVTVLIFERRLLPPAVRQVFDASRARLLQRAPMHSNFPR